MSSTLIAQNYVVDADAASLGLLVVRVCAGVAMAAHGYQKFFKGGKIAGTASWFDSMGMRPGRFHAILAASTELGAGILFALGLVTPLAALAIVAAPATSSSPAAIHTMIDRWVAYPCWG